MKTIILSIITATFSLFASAEPINEKAKQAFEQTFKDATNVKWIQYAEAVEVTFLQSNIETRVVYDRDGNIVQSIRYYQESQLPLFIRTKLQKKYTDMKVFGVTELATENGTTYHVILENDKSWLHVETDINGGIGITKKMRKI